ncbi:helix-turn-helix domain-containing protein [Streptomyces sp. NPDC013157]|uniref:helix-turn-helix domain-containing protein n=1 Tax=Streptomyces sp. NPDC013157 TaxID=3364861 RepID=UPI003685EA55
METGRSPVRCAEEQHVHRNTIVYRMRRIEELPPPPITEMHLEIHTARHLASSTAPESSPPPGPTAAERAATDGWPSRAAKPTALTPTADRTTGPVRSQAAGPQGRRPAARPRPSLRPRSAALSARA